MAVGIDLLNFDQTVVSIVFLLFWNLKVFLMYKLHIIQSYSPGGADSTRTGESRWALPHISSCMCSSIGSHVIYRCTIDLLNLSLPLQQNRDSKNYFF